MVSPARRTFRNAIALYFALGLSDALVPSPSHNIRVPFMVRLALGKQNESNNNEEVFIYDQKAKIVAGGKEDSSTEANYLDDLTPPPINFARDSILFGENPSTRSNNGVLKVWQSCKTNLPAVFTGAWPWRDTQVADDNPMGALYNMAFVRLPVIAIVAIYSKNLVEGHPLVMDIGQGPFAMSPLVVYAVLALILA